MSEQQHPSEPQEPATTWDALERPAPRTPDPAGHTDPTATVDPDDPAAQAASVEAGLARLDPLAVRPRTSSIVLCAVFAVAFAAVAAAAYWLGVHTVVGQSFEDMAIRNYEASSASWPIRRGLQSGVVVGIALALGAIGFIVAAIRRRWWLLGQLAGFCLLAFAAGKLLKPLLPRPLLVHVESSVNNSAPSGHTLLAAAAGLALLCAVPRAWRAVAALASTLFAWVVGESVIVDQWHRPADVVMAIFLAGALMMLALAFTRRTGMDRPGTRVSSPSVQVCATCLVTLGVCAFAYAAYVVWQVAEGLSLGSGWAVSGACASTTAMVAGSAMLVNGMVLMMRQLTASPLTRLGLIGAPPAPPAV